MNGNTLSVLTEVADERARQDAKWGPVQNIENGTGEEALHLIGNFPINEYRMLLDTARAQNDGESPDEATFESVLREEFIEAMLEDDPPKLRAELIQVAAVAVKWVEHIDRRAA